MSAAFTPGPWKLNIEPYEDDPFPGKDFFSLRMGDNTITGITEPANANLIAASPDLLEAVESLFSALEGYIPKSEARAKARAALHKARGEQSL